MRFAHNPSTWGGRILSSALNAGDYLIKHGFNRDIQPLTHAIPAICLFNLQQLTGRTDFLHSAQEMAVRCVESVEMGGVAPNGVYGQMLAKAYKTPKRDRFVERASLLAQSVLGDQKPDGSWAGRPFPDSQWIVFLIKLYKRTKSEEFLEASKCCAD